MLIKINNWEKYNPKRDQKTYTWLRLNNDIPTEKKLFGLNALQKYVWIMILCEASKENKDTFDLDLEYLAHLIEVDLLDVRQVIAHALKKQLIQEVSKDGQMELLPRATGCDRARPDSVVSRQNTTPTNERTNERNTCSMDHRADEIYAAYPRKEGKKKGLAKLKTILKTDEDFFNVEHALVTYKKHLAKNKTEPRFVKHFDTWVNSWEDWLEKDAGEFVKPKAQPKPVQQQPPPVEIERNLPDEQVSQMLDSLPWRKKEEKHETEELQGPEGEAPGVGSDPPGGILEAQP